MLPAEPGQEGEHDFLSVQVKIAVQKKTFNRALAAMERGIASDIGDSLINLSAVCHRGGVNTVRRQKDIGHGHICRWESESGASSLTVDNPARKAVRPAEHGSRELHVAGFDNASEPGGADRRTVEHER